MSTPSRRRPGDQSPLAFVLPVDVEAVRTPTQAEEPSPVVEPTAAVAPAEPAPVASLPKKPRKQAPAPAVPPASDYDDGKTTVTVSIRTSLKKRAEMAVLSTAIHPGGQRSLAGLIEYAMERELERLAQEFNDGEPFKPNAGGFRQGRPFGP